MQEDILFDGDVFFLKRKSRLRVQFFQKRPANFHLKPSLEDGISNNI